MNTIRYCSIAVLSMLTASAFAQTTSSDQMMAPAPMPPSSVQPMAPMNGPTGAPMNDSNMNSSGASGTDAGRSGRDAAMPDSSGASGTTGAYATGASRMGRAVNGSQTNANDVHATPQPGSLDNQIYRGN